MHSNLYQEVLRALELGFLDFRRDNHNQFKTAMCPQRKEER
jgi:hypothetical protein